MHVILHLPVLEKWNKNRVKREFFRFLNHVIFKSCKKKIVWKENQIWFFLNMYTYNIDRRMNVISDLGSVCRNRVLNKRNKRKSDGLISLVVGILLSISIARWVVISKGSDLIESDRVKPRWVFRSRIKRKKIAT